MSSNDPNPYEAPNREAEKTGKGVSWRMAPAALLAAISLYVALIELIPLVLRAIQIFSVSDGTLIALRIIAIAVLLLVAIGFGISSVACWRGRWSQVCLVGGGAAALFIVGRYLIIANYL